MIGLIVSEVTRIVQERAVVGAASACIGAILANWSHTDNPLLALQRRPMSDKMACEVTVSESTPTQEVISDICLHILHMIRVYLIMFEDTD